MIFTRYLAAAVACMTVATPVHAGVDDWVQRQLDRHLPLDADTVARGLRAALEKGTQHAVETLGHENGFWVHPTLRIPVPPNLRKVEAGLRQLRQDKIADDFIHSLNRAAEDATPAARAIFLEAIRNMTVPDALGILKGPPDAATRYFRQHAQAPLAAAFRPIVARSTAAVGVTASYKRFVKKASPFGLVDAQEFDLDEYVTAKALDALFQLIADEERHIREDPLARTTELLRKVFR